MFLMFKDAHAFDQTIGGDGTDGTVLVRNMQQMFEHALVLNFSNLNTSSVTNMQNMFNHARKFDQPLNDTAQVINMRYACQYNVFNSTINFTSTSRVRR